MSSGDWESAPALPGEPDRLCCALHVDRGGADGSHVRLDSEELFNYPFVWLTGHLPVRFTEAERRNLKRYVERGGFMMVDDHNHDITASSTRRRRRRSRRLFGKLEEVPNDHEIYRCFFTFENGPPHTNHELNGWGDDLLHPYLSSWGRAPGIGGGTGSGCCTATRTTARSGTSTRRRSGRCSRTRRSSG